MEGLPAQRLWSRLACAGLETPATAGLPPQETKTVSWGPRSGDRRYIFLRRVGNGG
jgi:hypothetical protein